MPDREYWRRRFTALEEAIERMAKKGADDLDRIYREASASIERDISRWYQRFADNNGLTMAEARRRLNTRELKEFRWTVEDYIRAGAENAVDQRWMKELENAAARVHISRLEALQIELQQHIEILSGGKIDRLDALARSAYTDGYYQTAFEVQRGIGVGWELAGIDARRLDRVLAKPWAADGLTFRDRCWTDQIKLISTLQSELAHALIRGDPPDRAIKVVSNALGVSRSKAGRLVMTESAFFASAAQRDCFADLGVEQYEIVETLDSHCCSECGEMDGQVLPMTVFEAGVTAPPFHPFCRGCTAPYFDDEAVGVRPARGADGKTFEVPSNMTYRQWRERALKPGLTTPPKANTIELTDQQRRALNEYISSGSYRINAALRAGVSPSAQQQELIRTLDEALERIPVYEGMVYRSVCSDMIADMDEFWAAHAAGTRVTYAAYTSSGTKTYDESMDIQMVIHSKTGRDIRGYNPGENEILFPRNASFRVVKVEGNTIFMEEIW